MENSSSLSSNGSFCKCFDSVQNGQSIHVLENTHAVYGLVISANGQWLIGACEDNTVRLWHLSSGQSLKTLAGYVSGIHSLSLSPNGQLLASCGQDETIQLWHVQLDSHLSLLHPYKTLSSTTRWISSLSNLCFSPDGQTLAINRHDESIVLWNVQTGQLDRWSAHSAPVWKVLFSPGGQILASGSHDGTVRLWDVKTHHCLQVLHGHENGVAVIAFDPSGQGLASGGFDGTINFLETLYQINALLMLSLGGRLLGGTSPNSLAVSKSSLMRLSR